jgi:hypothetical protein
MEFEYNKNIVRPLPKYVTKKVFHCKNNGNSYVLLYHNKKKAVPCMAQAVSRWPLTAEDRVRAHVDPCGICDGQSGIGAGFSPSSSVFPCQYHSALLHIHLSLPCEVCNSSDQAVHYHHLGPKLGLHF